MATIVQPYNDWRERAAVNILGPIITGLLNRHFENETNRKNNALMAKTISDVQNAQQSTGLLQSQPMPEGYNANGWASAFHQTENPIAGYDIATTGLVPIQSLQKAPTIQDIQDALIRNMGTRRFGQVNPAAVQANMTPYLQSLEQARMEQRRNDVVSSYANAPDAAGKRDVIMRGIINGTLPESMGAVALQYNPYPQGFTHDDGVATHFMNRDPQTGEVTEIQRVMNRLSPQQIADNAFRDRQLAQQVEQNRAELAYKAAHDAATLRAQNQPKWKVETGDDGRKYQVDQYGNRMPLTPEAVVLSPVAKERIGTLETRKKSLSEKRESLIKKRKQITDEISNGVGEYYLDNNDTQTGSPALTAIDLELDQIERDMKDCDTEIDSIYTGAMNSVNGGKTGSSQSVGLGKTSYNEMRGVVEGASGRYGVEPELVRAVIQAESNWNAKAVSKAGAQGLMQLMPSTFKQIAKELKADYGIELTDPYDPEQNVEAGTYYLGKLLKKYDGDIEKALWAYNAGTGNVAKGQAKGHKPAETQAYIPKVTGIYNQLKSKRPAQTVGTTRTVEQMPMYVKSNGKTIYRDDFERIMRRAGKSEEETHKGLIEEGYTPNESIMNAYRQPDNVNVTSGDVAPNTVQVRQDVQAPTPEVVTTSPDISKQGQKTALSRASDIASRIMSLSATSPEVINHATSEDIRAGLDKLNGEDTANMPQKAIF